MNNRKKVGILAILLILLTVSVTSVAAITNGDLDGNDHPYVGLMVADDADGNSLGWRCSGTLISPTIFLTAGHCTDGAARATVWFEADVQSGIPGNGYPEGGSTSFDGTAYTHPDYNPNAFLFYDLGVVVLDSPVLNDEFGNPITEYGALPSLGQLNAMATRRGRQDTSFTSVGYGLQRINPVFVEAERVRMVAHPHLIMINVPGFVGDFSIMLSNNHSTGGTCFGDSGGPNFINDTNVIGGVTSFGINGNCAGTGGVYRVDTADDLDWLYEDFGITPP